MKVQILWSYYDNSASADRIRVSGYDNRVSTYYQVMTIARVQTVSNYDNMLGTDRIKL